MGADYYAKAVIGLRVYPSDLVKEKYTERRGCMHKVPDDGFPYCAQCGQPRIIKDVETVNLLDGLAIEAAYSTDEEHAVLYLGKHFVATNSSRHDESPKMQYLDNNAVQVARETLKSKLEPLGLWNEKYFGLWAVLYCSY
jgi:hypothetical protein